MNAREHRWPLSLAAALALALGLSCYLWWRPSGAGPALLLGSTPALTHAFAFALLLLLVADPQRPSTRRWLLGAWLALLVAFEALQLQAVQPWLATQVQSLDAGATALAKLLRHYGAGTFDLWDVLASALGVWLAAALVRGPPPVACPFHCELDSARPPDAPPP